MFWKIVPAALCLGLAVAPALPRQAVAQLYCSQPVEPYCTEDEKPFVDSAAARACGEQLDRFNAQLDRYQACLQRSVDRSEDRQQQINEEFRRRGEQETSAAAPRHS